MFWASIRVGALAVLDFYGLIALTERCRDLLASVASAWKDEILTTIRECRMQRIVAGLFAASVAMAALPAIALGSVTSS